MVWIGFYRFVKCPSDADTWLPPTATSSLLFANSKRTVIYNHHFYLAWLFILITDARCPLWSDHVPALALSIVKIYVCVCVCVLTGIQSVIFYEFWNFFFFYYVCYFALALLVLVSGLLPFVCLRLPTVILKRCNVHGVVSSVIYETAPATRNRGQCHWAALHQIISAAKRFSWRCRIPWQLVETEGKLKGISGNRRQIDAVSFTIQCPSL